MARKKLNRFAELQKFPNVFHREQVCRRANWVQNHFGNDFPVILELGCGRGEYTLALARHYRNRNVIGIDRKGARIWKGARTALHEEIHNAAFLRGKIEELTDCIESDQVAEIWIPFPDPLPKRKQAKHRLISRPFLDSYRAILRKDGKIHLKTDDGNLLAYLLDLLPECCGVVHAISEDLYAAEPSDPLLAIRTTYELRHLEEGRTIKYLCFGFVEAGEIAGPAV